MRQLDHRRFKDDLYTGFARIAQAVASPKRLEIVDLLAQRERSVEDLARELHLSVANTSRHLRVLAGARLVELRKAGTFVHYRLANPAVYRLVRDMQTLARARLPEVDAVMRRDLGDRHVVDMTPAAVRKRLSDGKLVLLDVRPAGEFEAGHIPGARNVPVEQLGKRGGIEAIPSDREIVVYCRGEYCVWADEAVEFLQRRGFRAHRLLIGPADLTAAGEELEAKG